MLIALLGALNTGVAHLDDPNKQRYECYSRQTSLVYNKNINSVTVNLERIVGAHCELPTQVTAELTLSSLSAVQQLKVDDFRYETVDRLVFPNVPVLSDEELAVLHIYSYESITTVDIFVFSEQKSSLQECFSKIDVQLSHSYIDTTFTSTQKCMQYLTSSSTNTLSSVVLTLNSAYFNLAELEMMDKYAAATAASPSFTIFTAFSDSAASVSLMQQAMLSGQLEFVTLYAGTEIYFFADVNDISISRNGQCAIFGADVNVVLQSGAFIVYADYYDCYIPGTNLIMQRLTVMHEKESYELITTLMMDKPDPTHFIEFKCADLQKDEQATCARFYAYKDLSFAFDVYFYDGMTFLAVYKAFPQQMGRMIVRAHGQHWRKTGEYCVYPQFSTQMATKDDSYTQKTIVVAFLQSKAMILSKAAVSSKVVEYCFQCNGRCGKAEEQAIVDLGGYDFAAYVSSNKDVDYEVVTAVGISIGSAFLLTTLILAILGVFTIMRAVKMQRKQSKNRA